MGSEKDEVPFKTTEENSILLVSSKGLDPTS
jgi:hypothetical protein